MLGISSTLLGYTLPSLATPTTRLGYTLPSLTTPTTSSRAPSVSMEAVTYSTATGLEVASDQSSFVKERLAGMSRGMVQHIFEEVDRDGNGEIDYEELRMALRGGADITLESVLYHPPPRYHERRPNWTQRKVDGASMSSSP